MFSRKQELDWVERKYESLEDFPSTSTFLLQANDHAASYAKAIAHRQLNIRSNHIRHMEKYTSKHAYRAYMCLQFYTYHAHAM